MGPTRARFHASKSCALEPDAHAELNLAGAIEIRCVDVERLAEFSLSGLQAGKEIERRETSIHAARLDRVADGLQFGDILVIEKVEACGQQFKLTHLTEVEAPGKPQIGLPCRRIAKGIASHAVDAVVAAVAVYPRRKAHNRRACCVELGGERAGCAHGERRAGVERSDLR